MARRVSSGAEVDLPEAEETAVETETTEETAAPKAEKAKGPKRGTLPEGFVTPHEFSKVLTERELHTDKNGGHEVRPQMVYSYIKNASEKDPFPVQQVTDSNGVERQALNLEEGIAWWTRKNERVAARAANAKAKEDAKAKRQAEKAATTEAEASAPATEAE